jgi:hypothetical protein
MGEGERRVSVSSGRTSNVDRRANDFNVLGTKLCNFRRENRRLGGMGEGERRRRCDRASGLRRTGQAQTSVKAVIAIERGKDFHVWPERPDIAPLELEVGIGQRLRQARHLQGDVVLGRVDRPFSERLVDFTADRGEADPHRGRDLPVGITGGDEVQKGLPALDALRPARHRLGPRLGALREG